MEMPTAPATYALIVANLMISVYALNFDRSFASSYVFNVGALVRHRQHYRIFTSSFLHGDYFHLLFNMITLLFFGPVVEKIMGTDGFLVIYFGAVMASGVVSFFVNRSNLSYTSLGASDGVAGIVLAFCVFFPFQPIYIFFIPIPIPAIVYGLFFIAISAGMIGRTGTRIAHESHLAGALAGVALTLAMRPDVITRVLG
jgi:membrane associated rhomboid family serine protease